MSASRTPHSKAREAGITGIVVLDTVIDTEGRVTRIHVVKSIPLLDHTAIETVQQWRYKPATKDGRPVEVYHSIAVSFPPEGGAIAPTRREETGTGGEDEIYEEGGDVRSPELIKKVTPEYPEEARRAKAQGRVELRAIIGTDGNVESVRVMRSVPMLDDAAVACVKQWKFRPATKSGRPVRVRFSVMVDFTFR